MAMLVALVLGASILGFTTLASVLPEGAARPLNVGARTGFAAILYAFYRARHHRRLRAFIGHLTGNTPFYNVARWTRDAHRRLLDGRAHPGVGRLHGRQAQGGAVPRHVPDHGRPVEWSC